MCPVISIGKVNDLFAGRGITRATHTASDAEGMQVLTETLRDASDGFVFVNLVDFDTVYGHRNDVPGYAANLERFDEALARLLPTLRDSDLLVVTADHGNDPEHAEHGSFARICSDPGYERVRRKPDPT